jgi:hypothetical protein
MCSGHAGCRQQGRRLLFPNVMVVVPVLRFFWCAGAGQRAAAAGPLRPAGDRGPPGRGWAHPDPEGALARQGAEQGRRLRQGLAAHARCARPRPARSGQGWPQGEGVVCRRSWACMAIALYICTAHWSRASVGRHSRNVPGSVTVLWVTVLWEVLGLRRYADLVGGYAWQSSMWRPVMDGLSFDGWLEYGYEC